MTKNKLLSVLSILVFSSLPAYATSSSANSSLADSKAKIRARIAEMARATIAKHKEYFRIHHHYDPALPRYQAPSHRSRFAVNTISLNPSDSTPTHDNFQAFNVDHSSFICTHGTLCSTGGGEIQSPALPNTNPSQQGPNEDFINFDFQNSDHFGYIAEIGVTVNLSIPPPPPDQDPYGGILFYFTTQGDDVNSLVETELTIPRGTGSYVVVAPPGRSVASFFTGGGGDIQSVTASGMVEAYYPEDAVKLGSNVKTTTHSFQAVATVIDNGGPKPQRYLWTIQSPTRGTTHATTTEKFITVPLELGDNQIFCQLDDGISLSDPANQVVTETADDTQQKDSSSQVNPSSEKPDGSSANTGNKDTPHCACPVNLANGIMWDAHTDFLLPGRTAETALTFTRTYSTVPALAGAGDLGLNWRHNYETKLMINANSIDWIDESGGPWSFAKQGSDYVGPANLKAKLVAFSDHYELQRKDHSTYFFSLSGQVQKFTERHGESVLFIYDGSGKLASVSSPMAGTISFARNAAGLISSVTRSRDNLVHTFSYDGNGRLVSTVDFNRRTYSYRYNSAQGGTGAQDLLTTITDPLNRVLKFTYYDNGKARQQYLPGGGVFTFVYGDGNTTVTSPDGNISQVFFDGELHAIKEVLADGTRRYSTWDIGYKTDSSVDGGGKTLYGYDANGNLSSVQRPEDSKPIVTTYDQNFNVPTDLVPIVGAPTHYFLDSNTGDVMQITRGGLSLSFTRDAFGNLLSTNNGKTTYADQRDSNGLLTNVFDLHNPETRTYDARNHLASRTFQSGRVLTYTYDDYDMVTRVDDSAGPSIINIYDAMERLVEKTVSPGGINISETTKFKYDAMDRLVSTTDAKGQITTYSYDPQVVMDKPISVKDPAGHVTQFSYDKRQRLIAKQDALGAITRYTYDSRDNLTSVTDPLGHVTGYVYDLNDRKIKEVRPSAVGNTAASRVQLFFYDGADHLVKEFTHSAADSSSRAIYYTYDPLDRLTRKIAQLESPSTFQVDDDSSYAYESEIDATLLTTANNAIASLSFANEAAPPFAQTGFNVVSGEPTIYAPPAGPYSISRDVTGQIASISNSAGTILSKIYDPAGRLLTAGAGSFSTTLSYDPFGRKQSVQHSTGAVGQYSYDLLDRITSVSWSGATPISEGIAYDSVGNITQIAREGGTYTLAYDNIDQLVSSAWSGQNGPIHDNLNLQFDLAGNRTADTYLTGFSYVNNVLVQAGANSYTATGFGERAAGFQEDAGYTQFAYRSDGRLQRVFGSVNNGPATYNYDALGRRVAKHVEYGNSIFNQSYVHLGSEDRILLGVAGDGSVTTYLDGQGVDEHLASVTNGVGTGYLTDHLGSVLNGFPAAIGHRYSPFGDVAENHAPGVSSEPAQYGFAGREWDEESGTYYNRKRNYDPYTGTWLSQEPLGPAGDLNFYRYGRNNPEKYVDPDGRNPLIIIGAVIGAGYNGYKAYQAGGSTKQILLSAGVGGLAGAAVGATGGLSLLAGAGVAGLAAYGNNAANQIIFTGNVDLQRAALAGAGAGALTLATGAAVGTAGAALLPDIQEAVNGGVGFGLTDLIDSGIPDSPAGNTVQYGQPKHSCP